MSGLFGTMFADPNDPDDDGDGTESIYSNLDHSHSRDLSRVANRITTRWLIRLDMPRVLMIEECSHERPMYEREFLGLLKIGNTVARVAEVDGYVAGFVVYSLGKHSFDLLDIAVHPDFRRNGVGRKLLDYIAERMSTNRRHRIDCYVRETNLAGLLFLKSCGFLAVASERDWFTDTREDGILMRLMKGEE